MQPGARTVQGELGRAIERLTGKRLRVIGSGRTDTGVHATGQVAAVTVPVRWTPAELRRALNAVLPHDLWVADAEEVEASFHPRYDAVARTYEYRVGLTEESRSPFHRRWCWPLARELDRGLLDAAACELPGEHPFRAFAKADRRRRDHRCRVDAAHWRPWEAMGVRFVITADRFLHHMVRYLVGTMVEVALGRRPLEEFSALLDGGQPALETSPPAPAQGLFLTQVDYPNSERRTAAAATPAGKPLTSQTG